jgi:hypothetical protein
MWRRRYRRATAGDGQVTLTWTAATGTPAPGYDVEYRAAGSGRWTFISSSQIAGTGHTVASLTNGTAYQFRVRASNRHPTTNAWHVSDWTGAVRATPAAATPAHVDRLPVPGAGGEPASDRRRCRRASRPPRATGR